MSVVLNDDEFEAVMKALLNAHYVTDVRDVSISGDIDCADAVNLIEAAMSDCDKNKGGIKLSEKEEETLKKQLLDFCARVSSAKASCSQEVLIWPSILKILLACADI